MRIYSEILEVFISRKQKEFSSLSSFLNGMSTFIFQNYFEQYFRYLKMDNSGYKRQEVKEEKVRS